MDSDKFGKVYRVASPGRAVREFDHSREAVQYLVESEVPGKLWAPDGKLVMTKGGKDFPLE